jgi:predicted secreted protein
MSFGLQEQLMSLFVCELDYLVFDRRAITRPNSFDSSGIERRLIKILPDRVMQILIRVTNETFDLSLLYSVG